MKTSLINVCKLSLLSAVRFAGSTEGEFYQLYSNNPPDWFSLAELYKLAGDKIKSSEHDNLWFNSDAAQVDPVLKHSIEELLAMIGGLPTNYPTNDGRADAWANLEQDFRTLLPPNPTIGSALETIRIIVGKHEVLTGEISVFVSRLSQAGFWEI